MLRFVLVFLAVLSLMHEKQGGVQGSPRFFYLSDGESEKMYHKMRKDGVSAQRLKDFVDMENQLLGLEKTAVCTGVPYSQQGNAISRKIKETFPKYNFKYHAIHVKQIAEPVKTINRKIRC
jgi:hypothetical protein